MSGKVQQRYDRRDAQKGCWCHLTSDRVQTKCSTNRFAWQDLRSPKLDLEIETEAVHVCGVCVVADVCDIEVGARTEPAGDAEEKLVVVYTAYAKVIKRFLGEKGREQRLAVVL